MEPEARRLQNELVDVLRHRGLDGAVLAAFASVPRHRYVERFWAPPPGSARDLSQLREWVVGRDPEALTLAYAPDIALVTGGSLTDLRATTSLSAPFLIAHMLVELELRPGLRVLEIGAGSGYHAALMAAVVGDPALVTSVDIDTALVVTTRDRLAAEGLGSLTVRCADGAEGYARGAPWDRIVATVGCADIAPAWIEQLAPDGLLLVPLVHGPAHPRVRLRRVGDGDGLEGRIIGASGFVSIQGRQAGGSPWPEARRPDRSAAVTRTRLGPDLTAALTAEGPEGAGAPGAWGLSFYLSLRARDVGLGVSLVEGADRAALDQHDLVRTGDADHLAGRLLEFAQDWMALGAPALDRYTTSFVPRRGGQPAIDHAAPPQGPWTIHRLHHDQTVTLIPAT
jgi:protein-L-isoaspartate(D-aspartate) O-methyltransferase